MVDKATSDKTGTSGSAVLLIAILVVFLAAVIGASVWLHLKRKKNDAMIPPVVEPAAGTEAPVAEQPSYPRLASPGAEGSGTTHTVPPAGTVPVLEVDPLAVRPEPGNPSPESPHHDVAAVDLKMRISSPALLDMDRREMEMPALIEPEVMQQDTALIEDTKVEGLTPVVPSASLAAGRATSMAGRNAPSARRDVTPRDETAASEPRIQAPPRDAAAVIASATVLARGPREILLGKSDIITSESGYYVYGVEYVAGVKNSPRPEIAALQPEFIE